MKHIKIFESKLLEDKLTDYQDRYVGKFAVMEYKDNLYLIKLLEIDSDGNSKIKNYEWDPFNHKYLEENVNLNLKDFSILTSSDLFDGSKVSYDMMLDSDKYNI